MKSIPQNGENFNSQIGTPSKKPEGCDLGLPLNDCLARRVAEQPNQDVLAEATRLVDENFRTADQAKHELLQQQIIVLKTTPTPPSAPRSAPPALTPSVVAKLGETLRGPVATELLEGVARNREMYRNVLIQLVTVLAPEKGSWVFDADQRWLGEKLGKSGMSAGRNMWALDKAGFVRYSHTGKTEEPAKAGHPKMQIDLQPLIAKLWESSLNVTNKPHEDMFVTFRNDPSVDVYATYSGGGKFADASMRTPYKCAVARTGYPTVLARSMTASALTTLDYLVRNGEATRAELVEGAGMSPGAAAGGTRCLAQLGIVFVEWDGPGTPKVYRLRPDWEAHLRHVIPHMTSYGAHIRLVIRTYDERIEFIDWKLKMEKSQTVAHDLREHKRRLARARQKWCTYGNKIGAYGRYVEKTPPWGVLDEHFAI
jgi:hypothetical protein